MVRTRRMHLMAAMLAWYSTTFTGPYAMTELMAFLNSLDSARGKEAKVIQELRPAYGELSIQYTIIYRADDDQRQEDE